jgi:hypothetical protein
MNLKFLTNVLSLFNKKKYENDYTTTYEMRHYILSSPNFYNYEDHIVKKFIVKDN